MFQQVHSFKSDVLQHITAIIDCVDCIREVDGTVVKGINYLCKHVRAVTDESITIVKVIDLMVAAWNEWLVVSWRPLVVKGPF